MSCEVAELRFSFNGISDSQLHSLFAQIEKEEDQIIIKRISDPAISLSSDDVIFEGKFSSKFLALIARIFPPPLSCKIEINTEITDKLRNYASFNWENHTKVYVGVTTLPISQIQQYIGLENSNHFLNLITSTKAGSLLKSLLVVKPKGIISLENNYSTFILPNHRIDLIIAWLNKLSEGDIDLDWLSGSTGEITDELVGSIGFVDQNLLEEIGNLVSKSKEVVSVDLNIVFRRALSVI